jgi:hypothetical protein
VGTFDRQIATAKRLIAKNGQLVEWHVPTPGLPADPLKPWKPTAPGTDVSHDVRIVFLPASRVNYEFIRALANSPDVIGGKSYGLMAAVDFEPSKSDYVMRDGVQYRIEYIDVISPNGEKILYRIGFNL